MVGTDSYKDKISLHLHLSSKSEVNESCPFPIDL